MRVPAFDSVITMLQNLIAQIDTEVASDEQDYGNFMAWFKTQSEATSSSIGMLSSRLQELAAILADLRSRQHSLSTEVARLNGEIDMTQSQITEAKDKRTQEHEAFVQEQLDFDNSIAACNKAVEILHKHYGDGTPEESTRPDWMSLLQSLQTSKRAAVAVATTSKKHFGQLTALLEQAAQAAQQQSEVQTPGMRGSTMNTAYEGKTDEALGIVGQVQSLAATFSEDKQSSIDQENELTEAFTTLMHEKTEQLNSLIQQRDTQQAILTQVNQEIGENENAEATAKATLQDEQAYLTQIKQQEADTTAMYTQRTHDRAEEKTAVTMAIRVLSQEAPSLLQVRRHTMRLIAGQGPCGMKCSRAASLLKQRASTFHSELLATAAMTTGSGEALAPVIGQLTELVQRIAEQQHAEEEHKAWCESELAETNKAKSHHEMMVEDLKGKITDTEAVIVEKKQAITDTMEAIKTADAEDAEAERVRAKEKADFETELADYVDSLNALNQAIDILASFYREQGAFIQEPVAFVQVSQPVAVPSAAGRADVPEMATLTGSYQKKGGGHVVKILKDTRMDFETGKHNLEEEEKQAVSDFEAAKAAYQKTRADLVDAGNRYNAELQTAQLALAQYKTDLEANEDKVMALTNYLGQVGASCNMLIEKFAERTRLRDEEKAAIQEAIGILQSAV